MSKKIIALLIAAVMAVLCIGLCGCGNKTQEPESTSADAAETQARTFIMGIDPEYPPFSYMGEDGEYTGFDVEVCKAVCDYLGWKFDIFAVNWDQKLVQLDSMECDCVWSGMTILDSMKEAGYIISRPYFDNEQVLLVKADSEFKSAKDLAGKSVAVQLGTSGESLLNGDLKDLADTFGEVVTSNSFTSCFTELAGGAVDAVFVDKPVADGYIAEHEGFRIIDEDFGAEQYGIAFRSGDAELCAQVEAALDAIIANGTYAAIVEKYPDIEGNLLLIK